MFILAATNKIQKSNTCKNQVRLKIFGLLSYAALIATVSAEPAYKPTSTLVSHSQSIEMAMLSTLPAKPTVLGSLKEIKSSNISSDYGGRIGPFTGLHENHEGLDIPAELGSPILAAGKGTSSMLLMRRDMAI